MEIIITMAAGFALDQLIGDPGRLPHPVRMIGSAISGGEKFLRKYIVSNRALFYAGAVLSLVIIAFSFFIPFIILRWTEGIAATILNALFFAVLLGAKSLKTESMKVYHALEAGETEKARKALSMIVGRDTRHLDEEHITRATVETVAENTSDGAVAPIIFFALGAAPLCFAYKAANTLDSMIGYKNEKYRHFGRFAARLDDILNYIPARLTAWLMIAASFFLRLDYKGAFRIYRRDGKNHPSPNSGKPEAAAAGALGTELGGAGYYGGKLVEKEIIGDNIRKSEKEDIISANRLMTLTSFLALILCMLVRAAVIL